jgi:N6-L-threonylcarbamoyladenine synthase
MNVLGIETSCDETAAAVVRDGREVLSSVVFSQVALHAPYGGVVPEIASRSHVEVLPGTIDEALRRSGVGWGDLDRVAVTAGPGLATSLLVGLSTAKGLAMRLGRPLIAVNHLEAHIYSVFLGMGPEAMRGACPFIALVVSGGHTCLVRVEGIGRYVVLGQTIDDAAGEAFDKGANLLGLGYPGGPVMDKLSRQGNPDSIRFPRGVQRRGKSRLPGLDASLCFSFSGLKTALLYYLRDHPLEKDDERLPSIVASYQEAIVDALVKRCERAVKGVGSLVACGGVSLNSRLRGRLASLAERLRVRLLLAAPGYCVDNAAMVAGLAGAGGGTECGPTMDLDVQPNWRIG